jgi:PIN domain nuclease of toxin-antitoxin system
MAAVEPVYVVDTHALLWHLTGDSRLSARATEIFDAADRGETQLVISVIVLAELYFLNQWRGSPLDFAAVYGRLSGSCACQFAAFNPSHVLDFSRDAGVTQMHDRIIVGLARRLRATLLTVDPVIAASGLVKVEW